MLSKPTLGPYGKLIKTLLLCGAVALALAVLALSFAWRLPAQVIDSSSYWIYWSAAASLALIAGLFFAFAYGLMYRSLESIASVGSAYRVIKRLGGLIESDGHRQEFLLIAARGGLWIVPTSALESHRRYR